MKRLRERYGISTELLIPIITLAVAFIYATYIAIASNPDGDAFFLIEHGRYICENGFPKTNPWYAVDNLGIIIQQPGCSLCNYIGYSILGLEHLWILAIVFFAVMAIAAYRFLSCLTDNIYRRLIILDGFLFTIGLFRLINTRSYQITIAITLLTLTALIKWNKKKYNNWVTVAIITFLCLLQVNYQMSFIVLPYLWVLCFITPNIFNIPFQEGMKSTARWISKETKEFIKKAAMFYVPMIAASTFNPYGVRGVFYMALAKDALTGCQNFIQEIQKPQLLSATTFIIALNVIPLLYLYHKKGLLSWILYLSIGTSILAAATWRCVWMPIIPALAMLALLPAVPEDASKKKYLWLWSIVPITILLSITIGATQEVDIYKRYPKTAVDYLTTNNINKDTVIYTDFNCGAGLNFAGYYKIVGMDARPDIYTRSICGEDIIGEWLQLYTSTDEEMIEAYFEKYQPNYFVTHAKNSNVTLYMLWHPDKYEQLAADDFGILWQRKATK